MSEEQESGAVEESSAETEAVDTGQAVDTNETTDSDDGAGMGTQVASAALAASEESDESGGSEETTASEGEGSGDEDEGQQPEEAAGSPEKYSDFNVPDGMGWTEDDAEGWSAVFSDVGASQETAQKLIDKMTSHMLDRIIPNLIVQQEQMQSERDKKSEQEARDSEYLGGSSEDFEANMKMVGTYIGNVVKSKSMQDSGLGEGVIDMLQERGLFVEPKLMAFFKAAAEGTRPDTLDGPGDGGGGDSDWETKKAHEKMGWDEDALPTRVASN
jgi:hypothetical protein